MNDKTSIYLFFITSIIWGLSAIFNAMNNDFSLMAVNISLSMLFLIIASGSKKKISNKKDVK